MTDANALKYRRMAKKTTNKVFCYIILVAVAFLCAGPFLWLVSTSFKSNENIYAVRFIPENPSIQAY